MYFRFLHRAFRLRQDDLPRVVADLEQPTSGEISVTRHVAEEARKARSYGLRVPGGGLYPWRTIEKNVALPLEIMGYVGR